MNDYFLILKPLQGHLDPKVTLKPKGTTGTLLTNIFTGHPRELNHPMLIKKFLESKDWRPLDSYADYRLGIISLLKESAVKK